MFGLGFGEIVIVAILALVLLGPDKLPEAAKMLGKTLQDLKKATDGLKGQLESEMYSVEKAVKKAIDGDEAPATAPAVPAVAAAAAARTSGPPPAATIDNVPGLDAALVDPLSAPQPPPASPTPAPPPPPADPGRPA
jgi:sec-independent protein translocase protein TatB